MKIEESSNLRQVWLIQPHLATDDDGDKLGYGNALVTEMRFKEVGCDITQNFVAAGYRHLQQAARNSQDSLGAVEGDLRGEVVPIDTLWRKSSMRQLHRAKAITPTSIQERDDSVNDPHAVVDALRKLPSSGAGESDAQQPSGPQRIGNHRVRERRAQDEQEPVRELECISNGARVLHGNRQRSEYMQVLLRSHPEPKVEDLQLLRSVVEDPFDQSQADELTTALRDPSVQPVSLQEVRSRAAYFADQLGEAAQDRRTHGQVSVTQR